MSPARIFTTWLWSAVSALLLIVVTAHAVAPVEAEYGRARGSAFSASTAEVSLKAARADVAKDLVRLDPALPPQPVLMAIRQPAVPTQPTILRLAYPAGALSDPALHPLSPRAPPLA